MGLFKRVNEDFDTELNIGPFHSFVVHDGMVVVLNRENLNQYQVDTIQKTEDIDVIITEDKKYRILNKKEE